MGPRRFAAAAALGLLIQACAAYHITFVASVCRENPIFVDTMLEKIAAGSAKHTTEVIYYCKCTRNHTVSGKPCMNLPNLGREVSSYLTFIWDNYDRLVPSRDHFIFFVNGGSGSKKHAYDDLIRTAEYLADRPEPPAYMDGGGGWILSPEERAKLERVPGTNDEYRRLALDFCFEGRDPEMPLSGEAISNQKDGARCPCRYGPRYCELFPPAVCPDGQKANFQAQLNCSWIGHSRENYADGVLHNGEYDKNLLPADRTTNFIDWLYDRWGVNAFTWERTFWHCCGNFGVTADVILERPRAVYKRMLHEMVSKGVSGGIAVMYFERAWRAIFALPADAKEAAPPPPAGAGAGAAGRRRLRGLAGTGESGAGSASGGGAADWGAGAGEPQQSRRRRLAEAGYGGHGKELTGGAGAGGRLEKQQHERQQVDAFLPQQQQR